VSGHPTWNWIQLFRLCHEWRFDGNVSGRKKKAVRTGYYIRTDLPSAGSIMEESHLIVQIFRTIKNEEMRISNG